MSLNEALIGTQVTQFSSGRVDLQDNVATRAGGWAWVPKVVC